jgi:hypothetical protein
MTAPSRVSRCALLRRLRRLLARLRGGAARIRVERRAGRWYRGLSYVWHLLVWSRIAASRARFRPIELPEAMLHAKGIRVPPPHIEAADHPAAQAITDGFAAIYALLFANLRQADLLSSTRHAIPGPAFRGVYLWDSAFIAQVWAWWDPLVAPDVLNAVVELREGDRLQHVVTEFHQSSFTQPPLIAWSLQQVLARLPDADAAALGGARGAAVRARYVAGPGLAEHSLWRHPGAAALWLRPRGGRARMAALHRRLPRLRPRASHLRVL